MTAGEGWDPDDEMGIWEHQGEPLTVEALRRELANLDPGTVVTIAALRVPFTTRTPASPRGHGVAAWTRWQPRLRAYAPAHCE